MSLSLAWCIRPLFVATSGQSQFVKRIKSVDPKWLWFLAVFSIGAFRRWFYANASVSPMGTEVSLGSAVNSAGLGASRGCGKKRQTAAENRALPFATESEIGPNWHFDGRRRWKWLHDGLRSNGYIVFCTNNAIRTSLCASGNGVWKLCSNGEMLVTFGNCKHRLRLLKKPYFEGEEPMFEVIERSMRNGSPLRSKNKVITRGRLRVTLMAHELADA